MNAGIKSPSATSRGKEGEGMADDEGDGDGGGQTPPWTGTPKGVTVLSEEFQEIPPDLAQFLQKIAGRALDTGTAHDHMAEEVYPSDEQLAIGPGSLCAVTRSEDKDSDSSFMVVEVVVPEEHADEYPDWEERLLNSYVLAKWYSRDEPLGDNYGWFPRSKLVVFPKHYWDLLLSWLQPGAEPPGPKPPVWLVRRYNESLVGLAEKNKEHMPRPIKCPKCESSAVMVEVVHTDKKSFCMGTPPDADPQDWSNLHVVTPYERHHDVASRYYCLDCEYEAELGDEVNLWS